MLSDQRVECLTLQILREIDEMLGFPSEIQDLGDVDVMEMLSRACMFLELLQRLRVDACDRDELQENWVARAGIAGLVSNCCAGSAEFSRCPIVVDGEAIVPEESCAL